MSKGEKHDNCPLFEMQNYKFYDAFIKGLMLVILKGNEEGRSRGPVQGGCLRFFSAPGLKYSYRFFHLNMSLMVLKHSGDA